MVEGKVRANENGDLEAYVSLLVRGFAGQEMVVDFLIDTGFSGQASLTLEQIRTLGLLPQLPVSSILADGSLRESMMFTGIAEWDGIEKLTSFLGEDDIPLLGMGLLQNHDVQMRVQENGAVQILPVPNP